MQRSLSLGGVAHALAVAVLMCLPGAASLSRGAHAGGALEERKLPMHFAWHGPASGVRPADTRQGDTRKDDTSQDVSQDIADCGMGCAGWVSAVGIITGDTPGEFATFAKGRDLTGATIVLDSSGGSVLDAIKLGRRWRDLGVATTVGTVVEVRGNSGTKAEIFPEAYCESMCVFLLLSGKTRYVPAGAHVRVHQIWMGDRADDATAANYSAQDVMIIERDVGRLAKYTFEMGGSGELLGLALSVPPWEPLHELTSQELRETNIIRTDTVAGVASREAQRADKPVQDRFAGGSTAGGEVSPGQPVAVAKTAEALPAAHISSEQ